MKREYVHGYSEREAQRLMDQAGTLSDLLHSDTSYPSGSRVLEAGCGVGAQTTILAKNSPEAIITSIDISSESLAAARERAENEGLANVEFMVADIFDLPFEDASFDHVFMCFVLEHLADPENALKALKKVIRPGGTITVIEGDHGSTFFHPESKEASQAIDCMVILQRNAGGNPNIGRELYPLLDGAGFSDVEVSPRFVYVDDSRPAWVEGFTRLTFTAMVEGVGKDVLDKGMMNKEDWEKGVSDLYRTAAGGGTFCYTFFKAVAFEERIN